MSADPNTLLVYVKNERGVAMPIYVRRCDRIETIWEEVATSRKLNQGVIRGKALVYNGRRLLVTDVVDDLGIKYYDTLRLVSVPSIDLHQLSVPYGHTAMKEQTSTKGFKECP